MAVLAAHSFKKLGDVERRPLLKRAAALRGLFAFRASGTRSLGPSAFGVLVVPLVAVLCDTQNKKCRCFILE